MKTLKHTFGRHKVDVYYDDDYLSLRPLARQEALEVFLGGRIDKCKFSRLCSVGERISDSVEIFVSYKSERYVIWARRLRAGL